MTEQFVFSLLRHLTHFTSGRGTENEMRVSRHFFTYVGTVRSLKLLFFSFWTIFLGKMREISRRTW